MISVPLESSYFKVIRPSILVSSNALSSKFLIASLNVSVIFVSTGRSVDPSLGIKFTVGAFPSAVVKVAHNLVKALFE